MRIYITCILSKPQETFLPGNLFFASPDADENDVVSENCIELEGHFCESSVCENGIKVHCRWKGVSLRTMEDGQVKETDEFSVRDFMGYLASRKFILSNMSACFDTDVDVRILSLTICGNGEKEEIVHSGLLGKQINFVA